MRLLLHSISAASVAVLLSAAPAAVAGELPDFAPCATDLPAAADIFAVARGQPPAELAGRRLVVAVDLAASPGYSLDDGELHYRMLFNDVAEGWSWQPQARPGEEDYYRWKYLPLGSVLEERAAYVQEEKIGEPQQTRVQWRYDYFLAFDNAYDFYRRTDDDEAGFALRLPAGTADGAPLRLHAVARLDERSLSESTTYWKAIYSRPVDFTLKKRYFTGRLEAIAVCSEGRELARILPQRKAAAAQR